MSSKPRGMQTKLKRFIYDNHLETKDILPFTKDVDPDGIGITSVHHLYEIVNGHCSPIVKTIIIICKSLSIMLKKSVTPNDIIDFE